MGEQVVSPTLLPTGPEMLCPPEAGDQFKVVLAVTGIMVGLIFLVVGVSVCTKGTALLPYSLQKCSGPQV